MFYWVIRTYYSELYELLICFGVLVEGKKKHRRSSVIAYRGQSAISHNMWVTRRNVKLRFYAPFPNGGLPGPFECFYSDVDNYEGAVFIRLAIDGADKIGPEDSFHKRFLAREAALLKITCFKRI